MVIDFIPLVVCYYYCCPIYNYTDLKNRYTDFAVNLCSLYILSLSISSFLSLSLSLTQFQWQFTPIINHFFACNAMCVCVAIFWFIIHLYACDCNDFNDIFCLFVHFICKLSCRPLSPWTNQLCCRMIEKYKLFSLNCGLHQILTICTIALYFCVFVLYDHLYFVIILLYYTYINFTESKIKAKIPVPFIHPSICRATILWTLPPFFSCSMVVFFFYHYV